MPHVGGGSNSGGFHSGGSHGSSSINTIRRDIYGNEHSKYYVRPGFYFNSIYVPYSRVHRGYKAIRGFLSILILGLVFIGLGLCSVFFKSFGQSLEDYSLKRYSEVYDENDKSYEYNILIEIVAYDNLKEVDYMPIVGDNVDYSIDEIFGNQKSLFGGFLASELQKEENKVENLYKILTKSLSDTNDTLLTKYYEENAYSSKIINRTKFDSGSDIELKLELEKFYTNTGYNISIDISTYNQAYPRTYYGLFFMGIIGLALIIYSIVYINLAVRAVKVINEEDKNGNLKEYYEGDISYEEQIKRHPLDEPYKYSINEYNELKKEFELDNKSFEVNSDEFDSKDDNNNQEENK